MRVSETATFASSWAVQRRVLQALFVREIKTRFGVRRLGYVWILIEPLAHIGMFLLLFEMGRRRAPPGMDFPVFLLVGFLPFITFRHILNNCMSAVTSNAGLFNYTRVKPFDAILSRAVLEGVLGIISFSCLLGLLLSYLGSTIEFDNITLFILRGSLFWLFSFGVGLNAAIVGTLLPESTKFIPLLTRPLYFISGTFFMANSLPPDLRQLALLNPVLTGIELLRDAFYASYETRDASLLYFVSWTMTLNLVGFGLYRRYHHRLTAPNR